MKKGLDSFIATHLRNLRWPRTVSTLKIYSLSYFFTGKTNIDKDSKNVDYLEQLEKNIMSAKIRNIFDVEFNKKF